MSLEEPVIRKNPPPVTAGVGELRFQTFSGTVDYEITGQMKTLASAYSPLRGLLRTAPEIADDLFRAGDAVLKLDDGRDCRIKVLAYSAGSDTAYFEIRI
ncbi:hypothetical protein [Phenylobacterium sp.]|uniref:hypothetical protein n=1 Tax=Phenylobacterium sp. TaxID=1871053 RepID=UPI002735B74D|nr:hypothetical protein [Phenylobacterium sp.]MDP3853212.1 hypothetical protein [Phenylobacterium sp.]